MNRKVLILAALLGCSTIAASAQTLPLPLLSGTTGDLPWGLYAGGLTDLQAGENRLRLSAPEQAKVLGTRYDADSRTALISYRPMAPMDAQRALAFATEQLQREGFDLTFRVISTPQNTRARALLRRNDHLIEIEVIQGTSGIIQALYQFRNNDLPERLLMDQAPDNLRVYGAPLDLDTVQIVPGRIFLTPPGDVLIDSASYRDREASLLFYGNYSLKELENFYLPFFRSQGFIETTEQDSGEQSRTYRLARSGETYSLTLNASDPTSRARVTLGP
ncbi:hypothetical protein [Deinococcus humi]|uniref:Uncharacterized protein n=1 Tax=Deinococcus humi TaxID=662880 RepID=A0A7W8JY58_9DEIO|nr:hypothetical protein [Deinococcus humi]MBB5363849.1 hypothetical protein [Deinococcus humi]GGO31760.1 hypothetical protein GCM10008949_28240 [Deinococcus humi]